MPKGINIMIIAGEISGDMHAAALLNAIRRKVPDSQSFGIGGEHLRTAGMETFHDVREMAVMGFSEVVSRLPFFRRVFHEMVDLARERRPDAVILVDYPGFNLRLAARLHEMGLRVIYYVCPQVWAWNRSRIPHMARIVDHLITIFPFEAAHFEGTGLRVSFAGHPLVDEAAEALAQPLAPLPWKGDGPRIALLPGSRTHVIDRLLPIQWAAARKLERQHPGASFIFAAPSEPVAEILRQRLSVLPAEAGPARWAVVAGQTRQVLRQSRAALVASGTATVEAALMRCPMAVVYRMAPLSYVLGRLLVSVDHIGMVNIIAGRRVCPELVQSQATPEAVAQAMDALLRDGPARDAVLAGLDEVAHRLGTGGAAERAADLVLETLAGTATPAPVMAPR